MFAIRAVIVASAIALALTVTVSAAPLGRPGLRRRSTFNYQQESEAYADRREFLSISQSNVGVSKRTHIPTIINPPVNPDKGSLEDLPGEIPVSGELFIEKQIRIGVAHHEEGDGVVVFDYHDLEDDELESTGEDMAQSGVVARSCADDIAECVYKRDENIYVEDVFAGDIRPPAIHIDGAIVPIPFFGDLADKPT